MTGVLRGRLLDPNVAPPNGERTLELARADGFVVEQILSGQVEPADYRQEVDEWVVVLAGGAVLEVDGAPVELGVGDWLALPAGTPHRLVETQPATSWLTVSSPPAPARDSSLTKGASLRWRE
jgi:mannose-6-phosphate isomerase-like protein (cupin superfamily)